MIVYGANIKPLTGELIVTHDIVDLGTLDWTHSSLGDGRIYASIQNMLVGETGVDYYDILCDSYKGASWSTNDNVIERFNKFIRVRDSRFENLTTQEIQTALSGVFAVYPLATPVTYQLTPTEIRSLLGVNNVWADCGAITELKYTRDLNLCINDIIARIEALESANNTRSLSLSPTLTKSLTSDSDTAEGKTEETEEETKRGGAE